MFNKNPYNSIFAQRIAAGEVGVIPTDTLYGIVCSAFNEKAIEKIYELKKRNINKSVVILISDISDIKKFEINTSDEILEKIEKFWPGPNSIIFPCQLEKFKYLHHGANEIAFRLPDNKNLIEFLKQTGPIIAPSANIEGLPPAKNIDEAQKYFGSNVDFYIDGGILDGQPSRLIKFVGGDIQFVR